MTVMVVLISLGVVNGLCTGSKYPARFFRKSGEAVHDYNGHLHEMKSESIVGARGPRPCNDEYDTLYGGQSQIKSTAYEDNN